MSALRNDPATLSVVGNVDAIGVNQDALGIMGRRIAVQAPRNASAAATPYDALCIIAACDARRPTQKWRWRHTASRMSLALLPCNASDAMQKWSFPAAPGGSQARSAGVPDLCVDFGVSNLPLGTAPCASGPVSGDQNLSNPNLNGGQIEGTNERCWEVFNNVGPVGAFGCNGGGANQIFAYDAATGQISTALPLPEGQCVGLATVALGPISTRDPATGLDWCLSGSTAGIEPCNASSPVYGISGGANATGGLANYTFPAAYDTAKYGSGPLPHSRYANAGSAGIFTLDLDAILGSNGSSVQAADSLGIINDDMIGGVTRGGDFCLDVSGGGVLEVWAAPLTRGRFAVALFNRSPALDTVTVDFSDLPGNSLGAFSVRDIWAAADRGSFSGGYAAVVEAHGVAFLILTPASARG